MVLSRRWVIRVIAVASLSKPKAWQAPMRPLALEPPSMVRSVVSSVEVSVRMLSSIAAKLRTTGSNSLRSPINWVVVRPARSNL